MPTFDGSCVIGPSVLRATHTKLSFLALPSFAHIKIRFYAKVKAVYFFLRFYVLKLLGLSCKAESTGNTLFYIFYVFKVCTLL